MGPPHCRHPSLNVTEEMRGRMLGRAKKKFQEYQQKNSPAGPQGAKTKKNQTARKPKTSSGDQKSQEPKVHTDPELPPVLPAGIPSNVSFADTRITKKPTIQKHLVANGPNFPTAVMTLSSTKNQNQLSPGLHALRSGSISCDQAKDLRSASHMEDLDKHKKDLDACSIQNQQLRSEMENLKQQKKDLQDQLQKQNEQQQKMACVQEMLKNDLELHKQRMQNLLSENSDLCSTLAHMQQVAKERELEQQVLVSRLQASEQLISELEITVAHLRQTSQAAQGHRKEEDEPQELLLPLVPRASESQDKKLAPTQSPPAEPTLDQSHPVITDTEEELKEESCVSLSLKEADEKRNSVKETATGSFNIFNEG
ncbi:golgin subfamily A member 2-like [Thomomys bottae]